MVHIIKQEFGCECCIVCVILDLNPGWDQCDESYKKCLQGSGFSNLSLESFCFMIVLNFKIQHFLIGIVPSLFFSLGLFLSNSAARDFEK